MTLRHMPPCFALSDGSYKRSPNSELAAENDGATVLAVGDVNAPDISHDLLVHDGAVIEGAEAFRAVDLPMVAASARCSSSRGRASGRCRSMNGPP